VAALLTTLSCLAFVLHHGPTGPAGWAGLAASIPACATPVAVVPPAASLADTVNQAPAGTCFMLAPGTYSFHNVVPKDGMAFIGSATDQVVVDGTGHENAFHGTAADVVIAQMTFDGFDSSGGTSRQEQAPIRGTPGLWQGVRGEMAANWLVSDIVSENNYASGIFLGEHWTVRNSVFRNNGVTGIGGNLIVGGTIENNIIHGNGAQQATGAATNGGGIKITQAGTAEAPVVVRNNELYDNEEIAVWCDLGCGGFQVLDNYIHDHRSQGVMFELSNNLVVRGNTILRSNTWTDFLGDFNAAAVTVGESRDALIENNRIDLAQAAVAIRQTARPYPNENLSIYINLTYVSGGVTVRNNLIGQVGNVGISTGTSGVGLIGDPGSITFTGNTYQSPEAMSFWWNDGRTMSFAQWQAEGRDTTSAGTQPSAPENQTRGPGTGQGVQPDGATTTTTPTTAPPTTAAPPTPVPLSTSTTVVPPIPAGSPTTLGLATYAPPQPGAPQPAASIPGDASEPGAGSVASGPDADTGGEPIGAQSLGPPAATAGAGGRGQAEGDGSRPDPDVPPSQDRLPDAPTGTDPVDPAQAEAEAAAPAATTATAAAPADTPVHRAWWVITAGVAMTTVGLGGRASMKVIKRALAR